MANQGIMHLANTPGGRPLCNTKRAIMSTTRDQVSGWSRLCAKCVAIEQKWSEERSRREAEQAQAHAAKVSA